MRRGLAARTPEPVEHSATLRDMTPSADPLSDVLASLHIRAGSLSGLEARGSWALRFELHEHIKIGAVLDGGCWLGVDDADPVRLKAGDCFLLAARESFTVASDRGTPYRSAEELYGAADSRIVQLGHDLPAQAQERTLIVGSSVDFLDTTVALLLGGLPPLVHIRAATPHAQAIQPLLGVFLDEVGAVRAGTSVMSDRLTEILFIQALRAVVAADAPDQASLPGWLGALNDPRISRALLLMHQQAGRPWTVSALGTHVGMGRASFAARCVRRAERYRQLRPGDHGIQHPLPAAGTRDRRLRHLAPAARRQVNGRRGDRHMG
ncbi:hypothetical protein SCHAM137S_02141 [Streptomyces chartreusis]